MDRNSIIGIILIIGILVIYSVVTSPTEQEKARLQHQRDSIALVQNMEAQKNIAGSATTTDSIKSLTSAVIPDSIKQKNAKDLYGVFAAAAVDSNKFYTIENKVIKLKISAKGGRPYSVELKKYKKYDQTPVVLFDGDSAHFGFTFPHQTRIINTNDLLFSSTNEFTTKLIETKADSVSFRLYAGENAYIEYVYAMSPDDYMMRFRINFVNMDQIIPSNWTTLDFNWDAYIPHQEKGVKNENSYTNLHYLYFQGDDESFSAGKQEETKEIPNRLKWIAFKQQFFSSVLIADNNFYNAKLQSRTMEEKSEYLKQYTATIGINYESKPQYSVPMKFYFGPNHYTDLKKYDLGLENLVFIGRNIVKWINKYVILPIFHWLNGFIFNYGIIILILTIIIKMALFPLTYKSFQSQAKMRVLKPQIDEINAKIPKEKAVERQQATMALYKKAGVNPLGGCLPMLLQFPILIAMFRLFPTSIELRHQGFLWATDLSTYDSIFSWTAQIPILSSIYGNHISLFTLLMTVSTIISMKMSQSTSADYSAMPGMKTMMYIMPVMFMFFLNNFSAGLTYYYFLANVITIGQNEIFKLMINEEKLLKQIHLNKAKPVKKSAFAERLEKMAKEKGYKLPKK
jgi:YidC/Oxa1 family membrane protein insertase